MAKEFRETGGNSADAVMRDGNQKLLVGAQQLDEIVHLSTEAGFADRVGAGPDYHKTDEATLVRLKSNGNTSDEYLIGTTAKVNHEDEDGPRFPYGTTVKINPMPRGKGYSRIREDRGGVNNVYADDEVRVDRPDGAVRKLTGNRAVRANEILVQRTARKLGEATVGRATDVAEKAQAFLDK